MDSTNGFTRRKIAAWAEFVCYMADATREGVAAFWLDGKVRVYRIRAQKKDYERAMRLQETYLIGVYTCGVHATAVHADIETMCSRCGTEVTAAPVMRLDGTFTP